MDFGFLHILAIIFLFVVLAIVVLMLLTTVIAWREKRYVQNYRTALPDERLDLPPYMDMMNELAGQMGFVLQGFLVRATPGLARSKLAVWKSPQKELLILIGHVTVGSLQQKRTLLISHMLDGKYLVTADDFGETDISDMAEFQLQINAGLDELVKTHFERLAAAGGPAGLFLQDTAANEEELISRRHAESLEAKGYAVFVDADRTVWHYSVKGALQMGFLAFLKQLAQGLLQPYRVYRSRPGS